MRVRSSVASCLWLTFDGGNHALFFPSLSIRSTHPLSQQAHEVSSLQGNMLPLLDRSSTNSLYRQLFSACCKVHTVEPPQREREGGRCVRVPCNGGVTRLTEEISGRTSSSRSSSFFLRIALFLSRDHKEWADDEFAKSFLSAFA